MGTERLALVWRFLMASESLVAVSKNLLLQILKYALVGVFTNLFGYAVYLALTYFFDAPKLIMTVLYFFSALVGFFANRRLTFCHDGHVGVAGFRYLIVQSLGYVLNFLMLFVFVDLFGVAHQLVQAVAIVVVAVFLFVLLRVCVFAPQSDKGRLRRS